MKKTLPAEYYQFKAESPAVIDKTADGPRQFNGVPYTGRPINHAYWGAVVFDLATTRANDSTPMLINHDPNQRAGFAPIKIGTDKIEISGGTLLDNQFGQSVAKESDAGFPWQMSVRIQPGSIEELKPGTTSMVNGQQVAGPATIWRNNLIREVSFTPTGVDEQTTAVAYSDAASFTPPELPKMPTVDELQAQLDALKASLEAEKSARFSAEEALKAQKAAARTEAVKSLFSVLGREFSDASAKPYLAMDDETFSAVASDLKATKPQLPDALFKAEAESGKNHEEQASGEKFSLDPSSIYAARRAAK